MHRHPNRALAVTFVTIAATFALCGPAPLAVQGRQQPQTSAPTVISVDKSYGTLEFRGLVERTETPDDYEFRVRLAVTFRPSGPFNRVAVANLRLMQLSATRFVPGMTRAEMFHRDTHAIDLVLTEEGETKPLPETVFRLPKSAAEHANHVGLSVSDGKLMWPIATELR